MTSGLYVHVPFCSAVCPYCDFAVTIAGEARREAFVNGVVREAGLVSWSHGAFDTVYLGGGTPSSLHLDQLVRLLEGVRAALPVAPAAWTVLEANPEDVTPETASAWRQLGVDGVSLGVQSFDDADLRRLGRRHDGRRARSAVDLALEVFGWISVDLIFGLPGEREATWRQRIDEAASSGAHHLSCYALTVHDGTLLGRRAARGERVAADDDLQGELLRATHRHLAGLGWDGYEVSNFAREPCHRSRHNRKYWRHEPYLGLGPSAHSFGGRRRWWNRRKVRLWQDDVDAGRLPVEGEEVLDDLDLLLERVLLGLRTTEGIDLGFMRRRYGVDLARANAARIAAWSNAELVRLENGRLRPTVAGLTVAEGLARELELGEG